MIITKVKLEKSYGSVFGARTAGWFAAACLLFFLSVGPVPAQAAKIQYKFKSWNGPDLTVHVTRPVGLAPDRPVVFVMHGEYSNGKDDRELWHQLALEHDFLLVAPEISRAELPGREKDHLGNLFSKKGDLKADTILSYFAIEAVFNEVRSRFKMSTEFYSLYGHSMGAEFVQRFVYYAPAARVKRIVAANAAWYMMPDFDIAFPYGLGQSAIDRTRLEKSLKQPLMIMLGEEDREDGRINFDRTPEIMAHGPNRLVRGQAFFDLARSVADELGVPFNWSLEKVEGVGHNDNLMAPAAISFLLGE